MVYEGILGYIPSYTSSIRRVLEEIDEISTIATKVSSPEKLGILADMANERTEKLAQMKAFASRAFSPHLRSLMAVNAEMMGGVLSISTMA